MNPRARRFWGSCAVAAALVAAPLSAQEPADTTTAHVVRPGDTLWDLARRYLGDPYRWSDIFQLNRGRVADPDLILPDWRLWIPRVGRPAPVAQGPAAQGPAPVPGPGNRTVFFESDRAAAGSRLEFAGAEAASAVTEGDFYRAGLLLADGAISPVGQLVEVVNPSVVPLGISPLIGPYARVYMTLAPGARVRPGDRLHLLRPGRRVELLGRIFESTGIARVLEVQREVALVVVEEVYDAIRLADVAVALPSFTPPAGAPEDQAGSTLEGRIVAFQEPHALQNLHDIAFVDLGEASGVDEGDEFIVVLPPERREWGVRPEIVVARLRVVRTAERTAATKVVGIEHPALEVGLPVRLIAKMR